MLSARGQVFRVKLSAKRCPCCACIVIKSGKLSSGPFDRVHFSEEKRRVAMWWWRFEVITEEESPSGNGGVTTL